MAGANLSLWTIRPSVLVSAHLDSCRLQQLFKCPGHGVARRHEGALRRPTVQAGARGRQIASSPTKAHSAPLYSAEAPTELHLGISLRIYLYLQGMRDGHQGSDSHAQRCKCHRAGLVRFRSMNAWRGRYASAPLAAALSEQHLVGEHIRHLRQQLRAHSFIFTCSQCR